MSTGTLRCPRPRAMGLPENVCPWAEPRPPILTCPPAPAGTHRDAHINGLLPCHQLADGFERLLFALVLKPLLGQLLQGLLELLVVDDTSCLPPASTKPGCPKHFLTSRLQTALLIQLQGAAWHQGDPEFLFHQPGVPQPPLKCSRTARVRPGMPGAEPQELHSPMLSKSLVPNITGTWVLVAGAQSSPAASLSPPWPLNTPGCSEPSWFAPGNQGVSGQRVGREQLPHPGAASAVTVFPKSAPVPLLRSLVTQLRAVLHPTGQPRASFPAPVLRDAQLAAHFDTRVTSKSEPPPPKICTNLFPGPSKAALKAGRPRAAPAAP